MKKKLIEDEVLAEDEAKAEKDAKVEEQVKQAEDELGNNYCLGRANVEAPFELFDKKLNKMPAGYVVVSSYMTYEKARELQTKQNSEYRKNQASNKPIILPNRY